MTKFNDLTGERFGRLTVTSLAPKRCGTTAWHCTCGCGNTLIVRACHLRSGHTQSCGCYQRERIKEVATSHGQSAGGHWTSEYRAWHNMFQRCTNPKNKAFKDYGGRGIKICDRWHSADVFLADMGPKPTLKHTIERINNDGNYSPENCKWATRAEQAMNQRSTRMITHPVTGETHCINEWSRLLGGGVNLVSSRINRLGWPPEEAVSTPIKSPHAPRRRHKKSLNKVHSESAKL